MCRIPSRRNSQRPCADVAWDDASAHDSAVELDIATPLATSIADAWVDAAAAVVSVASSTDNATPCPARWTLAMPRWVGSTSAKRPYEIRGEPAGKVHVERSISTA